MEETIEAVPNDIAKPYVLSEASLMKELERLSPPSPLRCIYRVPDRFRRVREENYTPRVISIGPFHHGKIALKAMEGHKKWYLKCFLGRNKIQLTECIGKIKAKEEKLRSCYGEIIEFESDEFAKIILVDVIFLIEFLCRYWKLQHEDDCIFGKPNMVKDVVSDLLMLENQLPFFILEDLYGPDIKTLAKGFLCCQGSKHFGVHLSKYSSAVEGEHFDHLYRELLIAPMWKELSPMTKTEKSRAVPSIEKLHLAGVKFQVIKSTSKDCTTNLFGIQFDKGTLKIPKLQTGDSTELVLRNLNAFEQCSPTSDDHCVSDYVSIMDELVNTPKDVELLVKYGIVENDLGGGDHELSSLINSLSAGLTYDSNNFYYGALCGELLEFHSSIWHKRMATLRRNYFNTPWATISFVAAVVLLLLTAIQTICSVNTFK